jgi:hypothetical protein
MIDHTPLRLQKHDGSYICEATVDGFEIEISVISDRAPEEISARISLIFDDWPEVWKRAIVDSFDHLAKYGFVDSNQPENFADTAKIPFGMFVEDNSNSALFILMINFPEALEKERYVSWTTGIEDRSGSDVEVSTCLD